VIVCRRTTCHVKKKFQEKEGSKKKAANWPPSRLIQIFYSLLADVSQPVLANEGRAGLADKAAAISIWSVVAIIGVTVMAKRRRSYCAGRTDRTANHTGRDVTGPKLIMSLSLVALNLRALLRLSALLLKLNCFRSRVWTHRRGGRRDRSRQYGGCGQELQGHELSPL
jgi:hypothetical protein